LAHFAEGLVCLLLGLVGLHLGLVCCLGLVG